MPSVHAWCTSPPALMQDPFVVGADAREVPQQTKGMHSKEVKRIFEAAPLPGARAEQSPVVRCGTALCRADLARAGSTSTGNQSSLPSSSAKHKQKESKQRTGTTRVCGLEGTVLDK